MDIFLFIMAIILSLGAYSLSDGLREKDSLGVWFLFLLMSIVAIGFWWMAIASIFD